MNGLKNCPFCGGEPELKQTGKNKMQIRCTKCHMGLQQKVLRLSMDWLQETLRESWNKRVSVILISLLLSSCTTLKTYQVQNTSTGEVKDWHDSSVLFRGEKLVYFGGGTWEVISDVTCE